MFQTWKHRKEWQFFAALPRADRRLAACWWITLTLRGMLPAAFAVAMGQLVSAVHTGQSLTGWLCVVGVSFVALQVLAPLQQALGAALGDRTAAWLYDRLTRACLGPPGIRHLEDPHLTGDLTVARDFDLGMTGPPLFVAMDFIAGGLVELMVGLTSAAILLSYAWWAPLVLVSAWSATHWLLRESSVWRDRNTDEVRQARRDAHYAYQLAVDPPASKELRIFGLQDWTLQRFTSRRQHLHQLQRDATRLRQRPILWCILIIVAANGCVFWSLGQAAAAGRIDLGQLVMFAQGAIGTSLIAFGGLNWALDGAAAPVDAVLRLENQMAPIGALRLGSRVIDGAPKREIVFRDVTFAYPGGAPILDGFNLTIPAGSSLAIVGQNGAGKTTLAKLLCRLYDPQSGVIEVDGVDIRTLELSSWRARFTAVFQDFIHYEWSLRDNVAPGGGADEDVGAALALAGADGLAALDTILARGYQGSTELSGGQWQRVALARALCAIRRGADIVLLDEPTAHLDVRGEAEIFDRVLSASRHCTTILVSHRFSTVRHVDRICVLEQGKVFEFGTHDELMAKRGRYHTMFQLQAKRFTDTADEDGSTYDQLN